MLQAGNTRGHKANYCPTLAKMCFLCGKQGHEARNCRSGGRKSGGQGKDGNPVQRGQVSAGCLVKSPDLNATPEEVKSCIQNDQLLLACGNNNNNNNNNNKCYLARAISSA